MEFSTIERFLGCALYESVHFEDRRASKAGEGTIADTKKDSAAEFWARASRSLPVSGACETREADEDP
jgi:hypothetical protein